MALRSRSNLFDRLRWHWACAQALVRASADPDTGLSEAIGHGWDIAKAQRSAPAESDRIARRPDIDEDAVAATFYALRAVDGSAEDAWWAVSRFVDAAFELEAGNLGGAVPRSSVPDFDALVHARAGVTPKTWSFNVAAKRPGHRTSPDPQHPEPRTARKGRRATRLGHAGVSFRSRPHASVPKSTALASEPVCSAMNALCRVDLQVASAPRQITDRACEVSSEVTTGLRIRPPRRRTPLPSPDRTRRESIGGYGSVSRTHRSNLSEDHLMVGGVSAAI